MQMASNYSKKYRVISVDTIRIIACLVSILIINSSYSFAFSDVIYSGENHTYEARSQDNETFFDDNYTFYWLASDGFSTLYSGRFFKWTAPIVYETKNVTIAAYVTNSINDCMCVGKSEIDLTILPRPEGEVSLEKFLESNQDDISIDDVITYRIRITNIGKSKIVFLPLLDDYPEEFLKPVSSDRSWDEDSLSALTWNNLLNSPLDPGQSISVKINFRALAATNQMVTNLAKVIGARDENEDELEPKTSDSIITGIRAQCLPFGPTTCCFGSTMIFSAPSWQEDDKWIALNSSNNKPVGGFDDISGPVVAWTAPAEGNFTISYNNLICSQQIAINQCQKPPGQIRLENRLENSQNNIKIGDLINYSITATNTGQAKIVSLQLVDDYSEKFTKPANSDRPWDDDDQSELTWNNLISSPLKQGQSASVSISFEAIDSTDKIAANIARISAKDEFGNDLGMQTPENTISAIHPNCPDIGPTTGCNGVPVIFSAPTWQDGNEWIALDAEGRPVGGFSDTNKAVVTWTPPKPGIFTISYNKMLCKRYILIKEPSLIISKKATEEIYSPQDTVKYTISYGNNFDLDANDVTVYDVLPDVEYINSTPNPDYINNNILIWQIGTLKPRTNGSIELFARIKERPEIRFEEHQLVSGEGYMYSNKRLSTSIKPQSLRNYANITAFYGKEFNSSTSTILVQEASGTEIKTVGHGSGTYFKEGDSQLSSKNRSIRTVSRLSEEYAASSSALPHGRSINYSSKWSEMQIAKNRETGATLKEHILYATRINRSSSLILDKNGSTLASEMSFEGAGHLGLLKMPTNNSSLKETPIYESQEDYLGRFDTNTKFDEYGKNVLLIERASGKGSVSSERRIGKNQRSYHSGTGTYQTEDQIQTQTRYMAKHINASYGPMNYTYTPEVRVDLSRKWKEGMWSKSGTLNAKGSGSPIPASFVSEEFTQADYLNKNTVSKGLGEMKTEADFSGKARFYVVEIESNDSENSLALYDEYMGRYKISRDIQIGGAARFDEPHLSIATTGKPATTGSTLIDYVITVTNDGNRALGPIYITDIFPPYAEYVYSSLRPTELNRSYAQWTLINLGIGAVSTLELKLNMTEYTDSLVNRVKAMGGYNDQWIEAENFSAIDLNWQSCCPPQLFAAKTAQINPKDPMLVHYSIILKNREKYTMTASIRDQLPGKMMFQNSSLVPSDHSSGEVLWNIIDLKPGETRTIDYAVKALQSGVFVNQAHIEAHSIDGADYASADVASRIEIAGPDGSYPASTWEPPACFDLNCIEQGPTDEWMPCNACGAVEPQALIDCSSCVPSAESNSDIP